MKSSRIGELEKLIAYHKEKYYSGQAEISDEKYDQLEDELRKLDPENPVLNLVGSQIQGLDKVSHQRKMLSLDKTYEEKDLQRWIGKETVLSVFKIDGSSCSLIYENGRLVMAKTRGDGQMGENVTQKALYIQDIPKSVSTQNSFEVRGEIYCVESNFVHLSTQMKALGLEAPTSQRNIVAGLLGRKENIQLSRYLSFKAFDLISDQRFTREKEKLDWLEANGFSIPDYTIHQSGKKVDSAIQEAREFMGAGDYLIDGLVFIYDNLSLHEELGETSHHPRYKIAFKFQGDTKVTTINDIEWGVSRNGRLTPVALVEPVELSGAMISRVTLHNFGLARNFELKAGDQIEIVRSGEVIPKFLGVTKKSEGKFSYPHNCPSCSSELVIEDIWLYCENPMCPSKVKEEILNYIRKAGIDDISDKRLEEMMSKGLVKSTPDLYRLTMEQLLTLEKVKDKLAGKMMDNINKTRNLDLVQFISAIGLEGVSTAKSEKIISHGYNTLEKFQSLTLEKLMSIEGFAEKSATEILASLNSKAPLIKELQQVGVNIRTAEAVSGSGELSGMKFCITGELTRPRAEIEKLIKMNGGVMVSSVSKNTNYLVTNETESSSSKFVKAQTLGIPIISEEKLLVMIGG